MSRAPSRGVTKDGEGTGWFGTRASVRTMREGRVAQWPRGPHTFVVMAGPVPAMTNVAYAARAGASGAANTRQSSASCSFGSVSACSFSSVMPAIISRTTKPCGATSITARLL